MGTIKEWTHRVSAVYSYHYTIMPNRRTVSMNPSTQRTSRRTVVEYTVTLPVTQNMHLTIGGLIGFIIRHGLHRYRLDSERSGCLHWTSTLISRLEQDGYVAPGSTAAVDQRVAAARANPGFWCPEDHGRFMNRNDLR